MKFLADDMLGTLARWLRILGYNTSYPRAKDDEMIEIAEKEGRVILTRDKKVAKRYKNSLYIESDKLDEQLEQVMCTFKLGIKNSMTLCSICNVELEDVEKEEVKEKVPLRIYEFHEQFWHCPECGRYYWQGSHWERIMERVMRLRIE